MGFWILADKHLEHVPGTALLDDHSRAAATEASKHHLKKARGSEHTVLVPQPSDDPNDPLNWSLTKRNLLLFALLLSAGLVGAIGPLLSPGYVELGEEWNVSTNTVAAKNGDMLLGLAGGMLLMAPTATKWGRRPVYLVACAVLFFCSIWSAVTQPSTHEGLKSFTASRVFQGFGMAPIEALVTATIGDSHFVHERGFRIALWGLAIIGGINVAPIVNGYLISDPSLGWKWCFWLVSIGFGVSFAAMILWGPETMYNREARFETDLGHVPDEASSTPEATSPRSPSIDEKKLPEDVERVEHLRDTSSSAPERRYKPARTFWQELKPYQGYNHERPLWKLVVRQFPFLLSPMVLFGFFTYGLSTAWIVVLSTGSSIIFGSPPYNFNARQTGLVSIGPLIGSIISTFIAGPATDWVGKFCARRNGGVYEPEFRLWLVLPMFLLSTPFYLGWGYMQGAGNIPWIGPVMCYSIINVGQGIGSTAIVTYIIDAHRKNTPECFAIINAAKNVIIFGFTQFTANWVLSMGVKYTFCTLAGLNTACLLTTIPMYVFGKRARSWVARHPELFDTK